MKLLVVTQYFWPETFRINALVKSLLKEKVEVAVLTGQPNYPAGEIFNGYRASGISQSPWEGATLYRVPLFPRRRGSALALIANYLSFIASGLLFGSFLLRRRPVEVVFVYGVSPILQAIPAIFIKWLKGAKLVIWVQDLWPESLEATGFVRNRWILAMVSRLVRWIYKQADLLLVQSEAFIEPVAALADARKIHYYPNSVEDFFQFSNDKQDCPVEGLDQGFSVIFAGNLGTAQALETIVEAAELLKNYPDIRIFLVGDGSRASWVREQILVRGLNNLVMTGRYPPETMPAILSRAGALLVTLKDEPIFCRTVPNKVQAYLAVGRPIIACLNGEGARIVEQAGAGVACAAQQPVTLVQAIVSLSKKTAAERDQLGQNGKNYFLKHYDNALLTQKLMTYFHSLLKDEEILK